MQFYISGWLFFGRRGEQSWHRSAGFKISITEPLLPLLNNLVYCYVQLFVCASMLHTCVHIQHMPVGQCSMSTTLHTVIHCRRSKEITLHLGAWILASSLTRGMGFEPDRFPTGTVSRPLPWTPFWIRAVIPTFRFPLIWSWHRGDGLLCISPSQDGGLFTWSPPDWIWSVAHLLCRPLQLKQKNADFFFRWVFAALSWVKYYSLRYICYSVSIHHKLDLMDTCCGYYSSAWFPWRRPNFFYECDSRDG